MSAAAPDLSEARRLLGAGMKLVKLEPFTKKPEGMEWNKHPVRSIDPDATGYGLILAPNKLCSLDPDHYDAALVGMRALGFDLAALMREGVQTRSTRPGSGGRSTFAADGDIGWLTFACAKYGTVLELRADSPNLQDCVPGIVYRDKAGNLCTQQYVNGRRLDDAPPLPDALLDWWERCSTDIDFLREQQHRFFEGIAQHFGGSLDTVRPNRSISTGKNGTVLAFEARGYRGPYNRAHTVEEHLERHGYTYHRDLDRWSCPTASGAPGIRRIPGRDDLWRSDHASDPLHGTFDAWTAHVVLDHRGDLAAAVHAADPQAPEDDRFPPMEVLAGGGGELRGKGSVEPDAEAAVGKAPLIVSALDAAIEATVGEWLLRPYLEADVLALMYGDYGTLKSFVAVDWSVRIALGWPALGYQFKREPQPVVYISAEGKGLWKRLRAWCIRNCPGEGWRDVLKRARLYVIRRPLNLSAEQEVLHLAVEIERLGIKPVLVIVDTLSRNSNGEPEKSTDAATSYLNNLDRGLRVYFGASVLFIHHVGHGDKERHRGPIVLAANTDAEIRVIRPDKAKLEITLEVVRLKDSDLPALAGLKGVVVELGERDRDGQDITSLAIEGMDQAPGQRAAQPGGRNQRELLAAIRGHGSEIVTRHELHELAKSIGMKRWDARDAAIVGLEQRQLLLPCVGGFKVAA